LFLVAIRSTREGDQEGVAYSLSPRGGEGEQRGVNFGKRNETTTFGKRVLRTGSRTPDESLNESVIPQTNLGKGEKKVASEKTVFRFKNQRGREHYGVDVYLPGTMVGVVTVLKRVQRGMTHLFGPKEKMRKLR